MDIDLDALTEYFSQKGSVILLESQSEEHSWSRKSYLAARPQAVIKAYGNRIRTFHNGEWDSRNGNLWEALRQFSVRTDGWLFGYFGYDLKNDIELLESANEDRVKAPDLYFMVPGFLLQIDHETGQAKVLVGELPNLGSISTDKQSGKFTISELSSTTSQSEYISTIREAQHRISEGDFYEINLSHQMCGNFKGRPWELYRAMKKVGPVPFGAFISTKNLSVCCQSPERFLRKEDSRIFSQPIKGTSERGCTKQQDQKNKEELLSSPKEQAENLMIVDLVRNDLSRIAQQGTVKVPSLFEIESFGTVHQMVSTIEATAKKEGFIDILRACFPMGSMTGAPKISAMKSIEELENYRRGIYSGAIGYISPDKDFDFNVVIRTAIVQNDSIFYSVGGAITSDSNPLQEWEETQIKSLALLEARGKL